MGYIMHDAIIVTAFRAADAKAAQDKAHELGLPVSDLVHSLINSYDTFLIAPDGSKEGWADSDKGDEMRAAWLEWAAAAYRQGIYIQWVHVKYGDSPAYLVGASNGDDE